MADCLLFVSVHVEVLYIFQWHLSSHTDASVKDHLSKVPITDQFLISILEDAGIRDLSQASSCLS